jgi:hypothetical protein
MGNFKIVIEAVGGHGVDREKKEGEVVNFFVSGSETPDALAKRFFEVLKWKGFDIKQAELIHWPGTPGEVVDNLETGIRKGNF